MERFRDLRRLGESAINGVKKHFAEAEERAKEWEEYWKLHIAWLSEKSANPTIFAIPTDIDLTKAKEITRVRHFNDCISGDRSIGIEFSVGLVWVASSYPGAINETIKERFYLVCQDCDGRSDTNLNLPLDGLDRNNSIKLASFLRSRVQSEEQAWSEVYKGIV